MTGAVNNPSDAQIRELAFRSPHLAAKWIRNLATGDTWFWPADNAYHAQVARQLHIERYEKGIAVIDAGD